MKNFVSWPVKVIEMLKFGSKHFLQQQINFCRPHLYETWLAIMFHPIISALLFQILKLSIVIRKGFWIIAFLRLRFAVNNAILPLKTDVLTFVVWYNEMLDVGTVSLFFDWIIEDKINAMPVDKGRKIMVFRFNAAEITRQG